MTEELKIHHPPREWSFKFWSTFDEPIDYLTLIDADGSKNQQYIDFCCQYPSAKNMTENEFIIHFLKFYVGSMEPILAHPRWRAALSHLGLLQSE